MDNILNSSIDIEMGLFQKAERATMHVQIFV